MKVVPMSTNARIDLMARFRALDRWFIENLGHPVFVRTGGLVDYAALVSEIERLNERELTAFVQLLEEFPFAACGATVPTAQGVH